MKKILILIISIYVTILSSNADFLDYLYCPYGDHEFCTENYYIEGDSVFKYNFPDSYIRGHILPDVKRNDFLINKINISNTENNYYKPYIEDLHESKYWNHIFYSVVLNKYYFNEDSGEKELSEEEIKKFNNELYEKYKNKLGLYIDDKRVGEYVLDGKVDYKNTDYFYIKNKILFYEEDYEYSDNFYLTKTDYVLKEKTIKKLDKFVEKVEKIKYDKEKLLKKIDKIYNKYKDKNGRRNKFLSEVLLYLHNEVLINKLKQNKNLLKFNYTDSNY